MASNLSASVPNFDRVLPHASLDSDDHRFLAVLREALSRFPRGVKPILSVTRVQMKERGEMKGLVGLTTYCCVTAEGGESSADGAASQTVTLYGELLGEISDESAVGVIAHELAHAWLNEHVSPEDSKKREAQADDLARKWGYGAYLDTLAAETETP